MIMQIKNDNVKFIYVENAARDYMSVAEQLGLCDAGKLKVYATAYPATIKNLSGLDMKCIVLSGYAETYYIIDDKCGIHIKNADYFDEKVFRTMLDAFNFYDNAILELGGKRYYGPFKFANGKSYNNIIDTTGKCIMLSSTQHRDVEAINTLLSRLDYDNGKMYEPMISRYLNMLVDWRDKTTLPIGYFNFEHYLRIIKSRALSLFSSFTVPKTKPTVLVRTDGEPGYIKLKTIEGNLPVVTLTGKVDVIDLNKNNAYNPFVIVSLKPFSIGNTMFPWGCVKYRGTSVYLSPINCPEDSLKVLRASINLLE